MQPSGQYHWRKIIIPALALLCLLVCGTLNTRIQQNDIAWVIDPRHATFKPDPRLVKILTFGHTPMMVSLLWIRALQDPSYTHVAQGQRAPMFFDLDLATDLDPANFDAYWAGSILLSAVRDDNEGALKLIEKAETFRKTELQDRVKYPESFYKRFWSREWEIPFSHAYLCLFEFHDLDCAAQAYREASVLPDAPGYLKNMSQTLSEPHGRLKVGLQVLGSLISRQKAEFEKDPSLTRKAIVDSLLRKRELLLLESELFRLNERFSRFLLRPANRKSQRNITFNHFMDEQGETGFDRTGGRILLGPDGKITSSTLLKKKTTEDPITHE